MGQISVKTYAATGSLLSDNQQRADTEFSNGDIHRRGDALFESSRIAQHQPLAQTTPFIGPLYGSGRSSSGPSARSSTFNATDFIHDNGISIKPGTNVSALDVHMAPAIAAVAAETRNLGLTAPTLTSAQDRVHTAGSLHPDGKALDWRGRNVSITQGRALAGRVSQRLGPDFDVQFETFPNNPANNHLHTEYDPKPPRKPRGRK